MAAKIDIWNWAASAIASGHIESENEQDSTVAYHCGLHYQQCFDEMLEWTDWEFTMRRVSPALVTNDRSAEWAYAYSVPADTAKPLRVLPDPEGVTWPFHGWFACDVWDRLPPIGFLIANDVLYTDVEDVVFEYATSDVDSSRLTALAARALSVLLASRIAYPVKKDEKLRDRLFQESELARDRAVASDRNRQPVRQYAEASQSEFVRGGYDIWDARDARLFS